MSASMAEVLMQAMSCDVREDSPDCDHDGYCGGHGKFTYCTEHDSDEWLDPDAGKVCKFAAHQAEVLAANGYGSIRAAAAVGWDAAVGQMVYEDGTPVQVATNDNPYRRPE